MHKENLTTTLKELGFSSNEIKDLLLYTLNTRDRQEQMHSWLLANKDSCDKESIRYKAQDILRCFLASSPYNIAAKNMPAPKWEPPPPKSKPVEITPKRSALAQTVKEKTAYTPEDPFDRLMEIFTTRLRA